LGYSKTSRNNSFENGLSKRNSRKFVLFPFDFRSIEHFQLWQMKIVSKIVSQLQCWAIEIHLQTDSALTCPPKSQNPRRGTMLTSCQQIGEKGRKYGKNNSKYFE